MRTLMGSKAFSVAGPSTARNNLPRQFVIIPQLPHISKLIFLIVPVSILGLFSRHILYCIHFRFLKFVVGRAFVHCKVPL